MSLFLFFMHKDLSQHLCQAKNINLYGIVNQLIFQKVSVTHHDDKKTSETN